MEIEEIIQTETNQDPDNPEWTADDFKRAHPAVDVVPGIVEAYEKGTLKIRKGKLTNK